MCVLSSTGTYQLQQRFPSDNVSGSITLTITNHCTELAPDPTGMDTKQYYHVLLLLPDGKGGSEAISTNTREAAAKPSTHTQPTATLDIDKKQRYACHWLITVSLIMLVLFTVR